MRDPRASVVGQCAQSHSHAICPAASTRSGTPQHLGSYLRERLPGSRKRNSGSGTSAAWEAEALDAGCVQQWHAIMDAVNALARQLEVAAAVQRVDELTAELNRAQSALRDVREA